MKNTSQLKAVLLLLITIPLLGKATTYTYDSLDRLKRADYPNGVYIKYSYDAGGNILTISSLKDSDGDGIPDINDLDDDNDLIPNEYEIANGMDPLKADSGNDINNNGYTNLEEYLAYLNPTLDTDNDGMPDSKEIKYGTDLNDNTDCPFWYCGRSKIANIVIITNRIIFN